jgi:SHS2 domain-containing protein
LYRQTYSPRYKGGFSLRTPPLAASFLFRYSQSFKTVDIISSFIRTLPYYIKNYRVKPDLIMKKYEILEHPAELRLRIYGKTIEKLFINAAEAMANILKHRLTRAKRRLTQTKEEIKIESMDLNSLLVDFLNEVLAKSQINKCVYHVSKLKIQNSKLIATLIGCPVERFDEDIKAVTYEDLNIQKINGAWQTILVFDI